MKSHLHGVKPGDRQQHDRAQGDDEDDRIANEVTLPVRRSTQGQRCQLSNVQGPGVSALATR